jgi:hypothetical protein
MWSLQRGFPEAAFLRRFEKRSNQHAVVQKGPFVRGEVPERTFVSSRLGGILLHSANRGEDTKTLKWLAAAKPCMR